MLLFTKPSIINTFESGSVELPAGKVRTYINIRTVEMLLYQVTFGDYSLYYYSSKLGRGIFSRIQ